MDSDYQYSTNDQKSPPPPLTTWLERPWKIRRYYTKMCNYYYFHYLSTSLFIIYFYNPDSLFTWFHWRYLVRSTHSKVTAKCIRTGKSTYRKILQLSSKLFDTETKKKNLKQKVQNIKNESIKNIFSAYGLITKLNDGFSIQNLLQNTIALQ